MAREIFSNDKEQNNGANSAAVDAILNGTNPVATAAPAVVDEDFMEEETMHEKKGLFKRAGEKIDQFKEEHPKVAKGLKIAGIVVSGVAAIGGGAYAVSKVRGKKNVVAESGECEEYDADEAYLDEVDAADEVATTEDTEE